MTIFLGFAAVNTGNNLIYLIVSAFLSFMGVSGFFGKMNIAAVDLDIQAPEEIYAQADFPLKVTARNRRRFMPAFLIHAVVGGDRVLFPFIGAGEEAVRYLTTRFSTRGRHALGNIHIRSVFPFNFFIRFRGVRAAADIIVFPRAARCELPGRYEKERASGGEQASGKTGYEGETVSSRNYIQGDPLKYVHWKATARTGELKTRELSSPARQPVIIDFDGLPIADIEERISCVTYTIVTLFRKGVPVGLRIQGNTFNADPGAAQKIRMLRELALYGAP